jgi:hypothetical protein
MFLIKFNMRPIFILHKSIRYYNSNYLKVGTFGISASSISEILFQIASAVDFHSAPRSNGTRCGDQAVFFPPSKFLYTRQFWEIVIYTLTNFTCYNTEDDREISELNGVTFPYAEILIGGSSHFLSKDLKAEIHKTEMLLIALYRCKASSSEQRKEHILII